MIDAYAAGLFDGEGHVGVAWTRVHDSYVLRASVTNNHRGVLEHLVDAYGGAISVPTEPTATSFGKSSWTWVVYAGAAMSFLRKIAPYSIVKRPQIQLALTFPIGERGRRKTPEVQGRRQYIRLELQRLRSEIHCPEPTECISTRKALADWPEVQEAVRLYRTGKSGREVAAILNQKPATVSYWLRTVGVVRPRSEALLLAASSRRTEAA